MPGPKIAIIGAGPAGLMLTRLLQQNDIACIVYEAEKDQHFRTQGGSLDLHSKAGQQALKEAGLWNEWLKHCRPEGDCHKVVKYDGAVLWDDRDLTELKHLHTNSADRPEIDRVKLREILLDSLDAGVIQWGHKIDKVEAEPGSQVKYTIFFTNGSQKSGFDLVVGADGAWSKVRPLLTDVKPYHSGITGIEIWALNTSEKHPWLSEYVGNGSMFMFDDGRAVIAQRNGDDSIKAYALVRQPESWKDDCGIDWSDHVAAKEALLQTCFADCGEDIQRVIREADDELVVRQMYMLPVGHQWTSRPGVTLIGDAAHLMTPFAVCS